MPILRPLGPPLCLCPNRDIVHRKSSVAYLVRAVDEGWSPAMSRRILRTAHRWVRRCFSAWTGYTLHAKRSAVLAAQDALSRMQRMYADAAFVEARAFTEYMVLCRAIANCEDEVREARRYCGLDRPRARSLIPGELAVSAHSEWRRTRPLLAAPCESISPHGASAHLARWALTPDCSAGATAGTMAAEPGGSSVVAIRPVRQWLSAGAVSWKTPDTMLGARSRDRGPAFEENERRAERNVAGEGAKERATARGAVPSVCLRTRSSRRRVGSSRRSRRWHGSKQRSTLSTSRMRVHGLSGSSRALP